MRHALLVLSVAVAATCASAGTTSPTFIAINGNWVFATGPDSFDVPLRFITSDHGFWCAAGDYVTRKLRLPGRTPIFLTTPLPRRAGQGLAFSLSPEGAAPRTGVTIFGNSGPANSVSASIALGLCEPWIIPFRR